MKPEISIILPAYNAARVLERSVKEVTKEVKNITNNYEILMAEDGARDGTDKIAASIAKKDRHIIHLHAKERLGRGRALSIAFKKARGKISVYIDVDLDISPKYIPRLIKQIKSGCDISTSSKRHPKSETKSPFLRSVLSGGFNFLVRVILGSKLYSHQDGLKAFKTDVIKKLLPYVKDNRWFWDTEILVIAQWLGYKIGEVPTTISYGFEGTTVSSFRDTIDMFLGILKLWKRKKKFNKTQIQTR